MKNNNKVGLIILDGWGIGDKSKADAVFNANTPTMDNLTLKYPNATLTTFGEMVGLPEGQMGNSEVGHLNIGAGRIVYQELTRINKSIREGDFFKLDSLCKAFEKAKQNNQKVHFMGLVSEGGVHSSQSHLHALCDMAMQYDLQKVYIHGFSDGRDCDPKSGKAFFNNLEKHIKDSPIKLASIIGRYFAMDRDSRWERIEEAYNLITKVVGRTFDNSNAVFDTWYNEEVTDEFIRASKIDHGDENTSIEDGDLVISFNFRTDRPREIITVLNQQKIDGYLMEPLNLDLYTMTSYDETFKNVEVIFNKENLHNTIGEVLANHHKTQVRIAETEKYPHVTFFFSGGREAPFQNEKRLLVNSPNVATYDLQPEMSAPKVTKEITDEINSNTPDFFCLNFANPDMVGHTGDYNAIIKAVETVDNCLNEVINTGLNKGYEFIVIADHGNADKALNADGSPNTAHSLNPVPVIYVTKDLVTLESGILADVAPTILHRMGVDIPSEMTGKNLIKEA
ncbi:2,3-bisphosphoglycerate-independent phosphoglycerate mutase [Brumimicrobium aurantiacum]|uniref:2,3-bisphosphoglycerate-independent phosphoglycerate mutase n=1 Tax=Brumimicrobium aurantiacum TaxID=1737063 RepID=A0A3E1EXT3_9FLAO|nr:2,3-bisphosphoglycerate-independent phosphoglycerate mutase [Brumimicrobium aurantiacum]RFC54348.1 2,3-bisphosphoglycerate-independent phosphoglycerate mutase [Brumimicrobium aurantiacum]